MSANFVIDANELMAAHRAAHDTQSYIAPEGRELFAQNFLADLLVRIPRTPSVGGDDAIANGIRGFGYAPYLQLLSPEACHRIRTRLEQTPCYAGHVSSHSDNVRRLPSQTKALSPYGSYPLPDALKVPELLELALNPRLLGLADAYFGGPASLYSVNVFWTFADVTGDTHIWHRDFDDFRFLSLFVFLTDVPQSTGGVQFIAGSHVSPTVRAMHAKQGVGLPIDHLADPYAYFEPRMRDPKGAQLEALDQIYNQAPAILSGPAGSSFAMDSFGFHRGTRVIGQDRLVCWIRYGIMLNRGFASDYTGRISIRDVPPNLLPDGRVPWNFRLIFSE